MLTVVGRFIFFLNLFCRKAKKSGPAQSSDNGNDSLIHRTALFSTSSGSIGRNRIIWNETELKVGL